MAFEAATVTALTIEIDELSLSVAWSEFDRCEFRQRARSGRNERGFSAQGGFGWAPSIYRHCTFFGVNFKTLGGFTTDHARFENCTFQRCRFNGHFAHDADWVGCNFVGKIIGGVWFGRPSTREHPWLPGLLDRPNEIHGNDFSQAELGDDLAWRDGVDFDAQTWPPGYLPRDDMLD